MTDPLDLLISRRGTLRFLVGAAGSAASLPLLAWPVSARAGTLPASGTASKSALQYQDHPKGTSSCANCANFIPGKNPDAAGRCIIVAGDISPKGWCLAYAGNG
ncbi:High potential iron-sulfur protein [Modicisalibacter muralis]|uniref:High-potential iron-sulfur protein n=1 Tax=Modicisalibacter muralis TaxID=119000 RepID=A0A1G9M8P3_9GAMM|nr:high-potential iron-sulfur protein [Halomonas muralis]SDL70662.1 High potential iron-sulfur protein [Halomonas muralis]